MKSTVAAVGLMATLASASAHQPRHFHWRRDNSTASAQPGYTTLTVEVTEVATITSCAPTVTNCPARSATLSASDLQTYVVTNVVHLTETVCPVSEAESISKSLVQEHSTGSLPGVTRTAPAVSATPTGPAGVPLTTGGAPPAAGVPSQTNSAQDPTITSPPAGDDEDEDDDCPADEEEVVTLSTTVTVAPFPTNGTAPGAGSAKPTGAPAYRRSNKLF